MKALAFSGGKDSMACLHLLAGEMDFAIHVDTGFEYPETAALVKYASSLMPMKIVKTDRAGQNQKHGIPADVIPVEWTEIGQLLTGQKDVTLQPWTECCLMNISMPLLNAAKSLGVTELYDGQRSAERLKSTAKDGDVVNGISRRHPIADWSDEQVFEYLETKMEIPAHFHIKHSSLDCYDCTAFRKDSVDRVEWMRMKHHDLYSKYAERRSMIDGALHQYTMRRA